MENLQRINVKIFTPSPSDMELEPFLAILHNWLGKNEDWLDIADYIHMINGPGVVLFGRICFVSFDNTDGDPGVLYGHRFGLPGSLKDRIQTVLDNAIITAQEIVCDPLCPSELQSQAQKLEISINDRGQAPNTAETAEVLEPVVQEVLEQRFGKGGFEIQRIEDPKRLFGYTVRLETPMDLKESVR